MNRQKPFSCFIAGLAAVLFLFLPATGLSQHSDDAASIERISPETAKEKRDSGEAILVCSYDDQRCSELMIPGAITRDALAGKKSSLSKEREIIFYCA